MALMVYQKVLEEKITENDEEIFFKPFEETFTILIFSMVFGMIYPSDRMKNWQILGFFGFIIIMIPALSAVYYDMYLAYLDRDMDTIFRHLIVIGPFNALYLKWVYMYYYRQQSKDAIEEMNRYFANLNFKPITHKRIAKKWLIRSFFLEKSWAYCLIVGSFSFPVMAICKTTYSTLFDEEPRRYFIHELRSPQGPGMNYEFPFFEVLFVNTCIASCMYFLNFSGYDGFFVQLILHTCMRMAICGEAVKDSFKIDDKAMRRSALHKVIDEHIAICHFMDNINCIFVQWMSLFTVALTIHVCICVFHLSEGTYQDMEFMFAFTAASIYLCMITSCGGLVEEESENLADAFYQSGWERVLDTHCNYLLVFMIARAQKTFRVRTLFHVHVNHELLIAIVKMAYTLLTFLKQT
uniref:Odorant receptor n=1 Tax=Ostrinia furnacalis TaxID=93504 RepID=A0A0E3VLQ1_OSTFU|nr:putative olfactory receptor 15 [Ostrinia furnacalis]